MNRNPLRIAHVVGRLEYGGVESVIYNYYKNIDRNQVQFDFYYDGDDSIRLPDEGIKSMGARYFPVPSYKRTFVHMVCLYHYFRKYRYKIVHVNLNTMSLFALFAAWMAGVPVRICHNHSTSASREKLSRQVLKKIFRPFSGLFATELMACSTQAAQWMWGKHFYKKGVRLLPNAISTGRFRYDECIRNRIRERLGIGDAFVVGHVGRFCEQKNHRFLLEVFREVQNRHPDSVLMMVGTGPLKRETERMVDAMGLNDHVLFLGPGDDIGDYYQAMDVFLFPSLYEGFSVVCLEAQSAGLPCVCAESVSKEADLGISRFEILSLRDSVNAWADMVLSCLEIERRDGSCIVRDRGYDIRDAALRLSDVYGEMLS